MQSYQLETTQTLQYHLADHYQIYQRVDLQNGDSHWQSMESPQPVTPLQKLPISSPKQFFFSERENLFSFDGECFRETVPEPEPFVLFGVQSCDLTAIAYQDQFFAEDPYYQARRKQALLVGFDCLTPCEYGFCHTVNAGPGVNPDCADIILHRQPGGDWLVLVSSLKGKQALRGLNLPAADSQALVGRDQQVKNCIEQFEQDPSLAQGIDQLSNETIDNDFWQQLGLQCLSCSGCTTLCPTCSCYGTRDFVDDTGQHQERFWDSCLYESFQREASQHNPSEEAGARLKRFWTHKFSQQTVKAFGRHGCVGCGRCEQTCPGVVGVHSTMKRIVAYQAESAPC